MGERKNKFINKNANLRFLLMLIKVKAKVLEQFVSVYMHADL